MDYYNVKFFPCPSMSGHFDSWNIVDGQGDAVWDFTNEQLALDFCMALNMAREKRLWKSQPDPKIAMADHLAKGYGPASLGNPTLMAQEKS